MESITATEFRHRSPRFVPWHQPVEIGQGEPISRILPIDWDFAWRKGSVQVTLCLSDCEKTRVQPKDMLPLDCRYRPDTENHLSLPSNFRSAYRPTTARRGCRPVQTTIMEPYNQSALPLLGGSKLPAPSWCNRTPALRLTKPCIPVFSKGICGRLRYKET
jgi:hypothetical protein